MATEEPAPVDDQLIDNTTQGRFELHRDGELVGWLYYTHLRPNRFALRHTEVAANHQHQGVAGVLVTRVLQAVRDREGTVTAICPFVVDHLTRTPGYADLIDARHPGYASRAAAEAASAKASD